MRNLFRWRWLGLIIGISLLSTAIARGELREAGIAFLVGAVGGLIVDALGIKWLRLWEFPRQPFFSKKYFAFITTGWGIFGMMVNLLWNWCDINPWWLALLFSTVILFLICELPNFLTKSWIYKAPWWSIVAGWFPLVLSLRGVFNLLS